MESKIEETYRPLSHLSVLQTQVMLDQAGFSPGIIEIAERFHNAHVSTATEPDAGFVEGEEIEVLNVVAMVTPVEPLKTYMKGRKRGLWEKMWP